MIPLVPIILLWVRYSGFSKLTATQLPLLTADELGRMRRLSGRALAVVVVAAALSFLPLLASTSQVAAQRWSWGVTLVGLVVAVVFDLQAESLKRRGAPRQDPWYEVPDEAVRFRQIFFSASVSLILPFVGLPWGLYALYRKHRRLAIVRLLVSVPLLLWLGILIAGRQGASAP